MKRSQTAAWGGRKYSSGNKFLLKTPSPALRFPLLRVIKSWLRFSRGHSLNKLHQCQHLQMLSSVEHLAESSTDSIQMLSVNNASTGVNHLTSTLMPRALAFWHQPLPVKQKPLASPTKTILDKYGCTHQNTGMRFNKIISSHLILIGCLRKCVDMHEH